MRCLTLQPRAATLVACLVTPARRHAAMASRAAPAAAAAAAAAPAPSPASAVPSLLENYLSLSKARLSSLVVLTTAAGYAMAPGVALTLAHTGQFAVTCVGVGLCAAAANTFNQCIEVQHDARMARTATRVLPSGRLTIAHAATFGAVAAIGGTAALAIGTNNLAAGLAAANVALYAGLYTPLKRVTVANTWIGALVGAVPPLIGYTAVTGSVDATGMLLAAVLGSWQMPHFMALSYNLRADYSKAGYRMMAQTEPARAAAVALRHAGALVVMGLAAPAMGITSWWFALDATLVSGYFAASAMAFARKQSDASARALFRTSLWHLPALLALMLVHKDDRAAAKHITA